MAAILTPRVVRRIVRECSDVDERDAVGIRLEPAAAIDENQDGTRGSNLLRSSAESANRGPRGSQGWQTGGRRRYDKDRTGKALSAPSWDRSLYGRGGAHQHERLEDAAKLNWEAAHRLAVGACSRCWARTTRSAATTLSSPLARR